MPRHTRRLSDPAAEREKLKPLYQQAKEWQLKWPPGHAAYWKNDALLAALSDLAVALTGEPLNDTGANDLSGVQRGPRGG